MHSCSVITLSDRSYKKEREDASGPAIVQYMKSRGYDVLQVYLLPDEEKELVDVLKQSCDIDNVDLILTTGGTGLSPRDSAPEATRQLVDKAVPGISEYMRYKSMQVTPRGMLSRGIAGIRKSTLIINLPGSPKAAIECLSYIIDVLPHAIETMKGQVKDCGNDK